MGAASVFEYVRPVSFSLDISLIAPVLVILLIVNDYAFRPGPPPESKTMDVAVSDTIEIQGEGAVDTGIESNVWCDNEGDGVWSDEASEVPIRLMRQVTCPAAIAV